MRQGKGVGFKLFTAASELTGHPHNVTHAELKGYVFFFSIVPAEKQHWVLRARMWEPGFDSWLRS